MTPRSVAREFLSPESLQYLGILLPFKTVGFVRDVCVHSTTTFSAASSPQASLRRRSGPRGRSPSRVQSPISVGPRRVAIPLPFSLQAPLSQLALVYAHIRRTTYPAWPPISRGVGGAMTSCVTFLIYKIPNGDPLSTRKGSQSQLRWNPRDRALSTVGRWVGGAQRPSSS